MAYIGKGLDGQGVRQRYLFTATSGQTTFDTSDSGTGLSYSDTNYMDVYLNGVLLDPASDYTATSGTSVVLGSGATTGDTLECVVYDVFSVFSGNFNTNVSVNGNLDVTNTLNTKFLNVSATNNTTPINFDIGVHAHYTFSGNSTSGYTVNFDIDDTGATIGHNSSGRNLSLQTNSTDRLTIDGNGNVGIGTSTPSLTFGGGLEVQRAGYSTVRVENTSTSVVGELSAYDGTYGTLLYTLTSHPLVFGTNGGERARINIAGEFISAYATYGYLSLSNQLSGNSAGAYPTLKTDGTVIYFDANATYTGYIAYNTGFVDVSDEREKDNIVTIDNALDKVSQLRGVYHTWKDNRDEGRRHTGLIAQEVNEVMPEVVTEGADRYGVSYGKLAGVLIEAIKELKTENENLRTRVEALESATSN